MPERELTLKIIIDASESAQTSAREAQQLKSVVSDLQEAISKLSGSDTGGAAGAAMNQAATSAQKASEQVESLASASEKMADKISSTGEAVKETTEEAARHLEVMKSATMEIANAIELAISDDKLSEYFRLAGLDAEKAAEKIRELRNEIKSAANIGELTNVATAGVGLLQDGEIRDSYEKLFPHLGALERLEKMEEEMQARLQDSNFLKYINRVGISSEEAADRVEHFQRMMRNMNSLDDIAGTEEQGALVLGTLDRAATRGSDQWLQARSQAYMKLGTSIKETTTAITQFARAWVLATAANKESAEEMVRTIAKFEAGAQLLGGFASLGANVGQLGGAIGGARAAMRGASPAAIRAATTAGGAATLAAVGTYALPVALTIGAGASLYSGFNAAAKNEVGQLESVYRFIGNRPWLRKALPFLDPAFLVAGPSIDQSLINEEDEKQYTEMQRIGILRQNFAARSLSLSMPFADLSAQMAVGPMTADNLDAQRAVAANQIENARRARDSDLVQSLNPHQRYQFQMQQNQRILQLIQRRGEIELNIHRQAIANKQKEIQALRDEQQEISATVSMKARALVGMASMDPLQRSEALGAIERAREGKGSLTDYQTALQFATSDDERKSLERRLQDQAIADLGKDASRLFDIDAFRQEREQLDQITAKIDHEVKVKIDMENDLETIAEDIAQQIYDEMQPVVERMQNQFKAQIEQLRRSSKDAYRGAAPNTIDFIGSR